MTGESPIVIHFRFGKQNVPDGFEQSLVAEPGNPFVCRRGQMDIGIASDEHTYVFDYSLPN